MENTGLLERASVDVQRKLVKAFAEGKLQRSDFQSKYMPAIMSGLALVVCRFGGESTYPMPESLAGVPIKSQADIDEIQRLYEAVHGWNGIAEVIVVRNPGAPPLADREETQE